MLNFVNKIKESIYSILYNVASLGNTFLFSYLVIHLLSKQSWDTYTGINLIAALLVQFVYFGNREYLLLKYAKNQSQIRNYFNQNFTMRIVLLLFVLVFVAPFFLPQKTLLLIASIITVKFVYQSYDSLVVFHKKFKQVFLIEFAAMFVMLLGFNFLTVEVSQIEKLLMILLASEFVKLVFYVTVFGVPKLTKAPLFEEFKNALPFFLIGVSGFVASKIDVYVTGIALSKETLGTYQILSNFLLLVQAMSNYIFMPYVKYVARVKIKLLKQFSAYLLITGLMLCTLSLFAVKFILAYFFQIEILNTTLILGLVACLPVYAFLPYTYYIMRKGKAQALVFINVFSAIFSSAFVLVANKYFVIPEINFPVLIMFTAQVFTMLLIFSYAKKLSDEK